jgi:hypothetical protein
VGLPQPGDEQVDVGGGVLADALKHIDQVVIGIDAAGNQGTDHGMQASQLESIIKCNTTY